MKKSKIRDFTAMLLIGDGVLALLRPERNVRAWDMGPAPWKSAMNYLSRHDGATRAIGLAEIAVGFALIASRPTVAELLEKEAAEMRARIRAIA
jgi:hypothetical protein